MISKKNFIKKGNSHLLETISNNSHEIIPNLVSNREKNKEILLYKKNNSKNNKYENDRIQEKEKFISINNDNLKNQKKLEDKFFSKFNRKTNKNVVLIPLTWDCFLEKKNILPGEIQKIKKNQKHSLLSKNQNFGFSPLKNESFVKLKREGFVKNEKLEKKECFIKKEEFCKKKKEEKICIVERFKKISKRLLKNKEIVDDSKNSNFENKTIIKNIVAKNFRKTGKKFLTCFSNALQNLKEPLKTEEKSLIKNFFNLLKILKAIFKNEVISLQLVKQLNLHELKILKSLLERKYHVIFKLNMPNLNLKEKIISIMSSNSLKRPEENYKFIFKRCLKFMKSEMKKNFAKKIKKKDFEKLFYEFYFKEISEKESIPLEHFFHPKNSKAVKKLNYITPKTINSYYINNISKSKIFMNNFLEYLENNLSKDYEILIDSKFSSLILKWNEEYEKNPNKDQVVYKICDYIKGNKKCKLPWNVKEIKEAIEVVKNLLG